MSLWLLHQVFLVAFLGFLLLIGWSNMRILPRLGAYPPARRLPRVSILVPARDEEANIEACVRSLVAQDYPDYEVLVLDDNSQDRTAEILARLAARHPYLHTLTGEPLPPGWIGKNWACHQLARAARGELLLFTDADTNHHPRCLADAVAALTAQEADLLTAFPKQEVVTWAEQLIVPPLTWSFAFLPLRLAYRSPSPALSITIGQFMLFRRQAYETIGGHAAVRQEVADDTVLGRNIKKYGLRWRLADGGSRIRCRMYRNFLQVFEGYSKNLFPGFDCNISAYTLLWLWVAVAFLEPPAILLAGLSGAAISGLSLALAGLAVVISVLLWGLSHRRFGFPFYLALCYPLTVLLAMAIAVWSLVLTLAGRSTWKGRRVVKQKVHFW